LSWLLVQENDVYTTVFAPAFIGIIGRNGEILAHANRSDARSIHP
jgi:hypothetical protein